MTWLDGMFSVTGDISDTGYSLFPDATKAGASTQIRARVSFKHKTSEGGASSTARYTVYENLKIKFLKDSPAKKKCKQNILSLKLVFNAFIEGGKICYTHFYHY